MSRTGFIRPDLGRYGFIAHVLRVSLDVYAGVVDLGKEVRRSLIQATAGGLWTTKKKLNGWQ
jgi:hypothetical protein